MRPVYATRLGVTEDQDIVDAAQISRFFFIDAIVNARTQLESAAPDDALFMPPELDESCHPEKRLSTAVALATKAVCIYHFRA